jgi:hypothetical protein
VNQPRPPIGGIDEDQLIAGVELVGRTGARELQVGYLHEDVPSERAGWYAHAQYRGARITVEDKRGPVEAVEALAERLLTSAVCQHCKGLVSLRPDGALAYIGGHFLDGTPITEELVRSMPQCHWRRVGQHWQRGCEMAPRKSTAAARRRGKGRKRSR